MAESTTDSLQKPPEDIVFYEELPVRGRVEKLKLFALDIKKPADAPDQPGLGDYLPEAEREPQETPTPTPGA